MKFVPCPQNEQSVQLSALPPESSWLVQDRRHATKRAQASYASKSKWKTFQNDERVSISERLISNRLNYIFYVASSSKLDIYRSPTPLVETESLSASCLQCQQVKLTSKKLRQHPRDHRGVEVRVHAHLVPHPRSGRLPPPGALARTRAVRA